MDAGNKEQELTEALLNMIRVASRNHTVIEGKIVSVDETAWTCDVEVNDGVTSMTVGDVPLETLTNNKATFIFTPNKGSDCLLVFRDGNQDRPQLLKIQSARVISAAPTEKWVFGKGDQGGIVLVNPLTEHINTVEEDLNELKTLISSWVPAPGDGGASLKALLSEWFASKITPTTAEDLASKTIFQ